MSPPAADSATPTVSPRAWSRAPTCSPSECNSPDITMLASPPADILVPPAGLRVAYRRVSHESGQDPDPRRDHSSLHSRIEEHSRSRLQLAPSAEGSP